jgi:signal transduction histidine kinase
LADHKNLIQQKIIISFSLIGVVLIMGSFLILQLSIDSTFRQLETEQSLKDLNDVEQTIKQQLATVSYYNRDYAWWDETYRVMHDTSALEGYIERHFSYEQWPDVELAIDGMFMFDRGGAFVAGALFDYAQEKEISIQSTILQQLESQYSDFIVNIPEPDLATEITGFMNTPEGLMLIVSRPILNGDYAGESRGRFLTAHFLNAQRVEAIAHRASVELELLPISAMDAHAQPAFTDSNYVVNRIPLKDTHGATLAIIEIRTARDVSLAGARSILKAMGFLSLAIIFSIMVAWCLLRHWMVQPLLSLKKHVSKMRETENLAARYSARTKDEVGILADEIDFLALKLHTTQTQLTIARDEAESSSHVKSEFLATMSHELRTPLNGVIGMTDILLHSKLPEKQHRIAETVMKSGRLLHKLIEDILDFSKMNAGEIKLINADFSLKELLHEIDAITSDAAQKKGIDYQVFVEQKLPDNLIADRQHLKQVLLHLLDNAVKFTKEGEIALSINYSEYGTAEDKQPMNLIFSIRDTGVGIREEDLGSIFELFAQADSTATREFGGAGLGLSICKDLTEIMGGKITVSSVFGEGTEYLFTVPVTVRTS